MRPERGIARPAAPGTGGAALCAPEAGPGEERA
jgi:hypothetical protein